MYSPRDQSLKGLHPSRIHRIHPRLVYSPGDESLEGLRPARFHCIHSRLVHSPCAESLEDLHQSRIHCIHSTPVYSPCHESLQGQHPPRKGDIAAADAYLKSVHPSNIHGEGYTPVDTGYRGPQIEDSPPNNGLRPSPPSPFSSPSTAPHSLVLSCIRTYGNCTRSLHSSRLGTACICRNSMRGHLIYMYAAIVIFPFEELCCTKKNPSQDMIES